MLWSEFLERTPPGVTEEIDDLFKSADVNGTSKVSDTDIQLYCDSDKCKGVRVFQTRLTADASSSGYSYKEIFISYYCRNCQYSVKTFALRLVREATASALSGVATKFGESPAFGPPLPSRLISLIGPDRELFLKGRRVENQGLGVGAFAYYRRVVENQKERLIGEIAKVAKRLGASPEVLALFERAAKETQFSKAVDDVKSAIPQALLIDGHNPLTLLHSALSEGLHAGTDEECLQMAASVRVILTELSERISIALKDEAEVRQALNNLLHRAKG